MAPRPARPPLCRTRWNEDGGGGVFSRPWTGNEAGGTGLRPCAEAADAAVGGRQSGGSQPASSAATAQGSGRSAAGMWPAAPRPGRPRRNPWRESPPAARDDSRAALRYSPEANRCQEPRCALPSTASTIGHHLRGCDALRLLVPARPRHGGGPNSARLTARAEVRGAEDQPPPKEATQQEGSRRRRRHARRPRPLLHRHRQRRAGVAHLQDCGVAVRTGPGCQGRGAGALTSVYCRDPDGNLIEIATYGSLE